MRGGRRGGEGITAPRKNGAAEVKQGAAGVKKGVLGAPNGKKPRFTLKVHPTYFLGGLLAVITGQGLPFLALTFCALLHEGGHALAAEKRGYALSEITLTPFGAAVGGDNADLSAYDELAVFFAGPLVNLTLLTGTVAVWWLWPDLYPYTEGVFFANASLFVCNLLPVFPLDGGRILFSLLKRKFTPKAAGRITGCAGLFTALCYAGAVIGFGGSPVTALAFLGITLPCLFSANRRAGYYRFLTHRTEGRMQKGARLTLLAFSEEATLSSAVKRMRAGERYLLYIYRGETPLYTLSEAQVYRLAEEKGLYLSFATAIQYGQYAR